MCNFMEYSSVEFLGNFHTHLRTLLNATSRDLIWLQVMSQRTHAMRIEKDCLNMCVTSRESTQDTSTLLAKRTVVTLVGLTKRFEA